MSYEYAAGLQAAIYQRLIGDMALESLIGNQIYDAPLEGKGDEVAPDHVTLGEEMTRAWTTKTSAGAVHDFDVTVHSGRDGFDAAKKIAGAVCAALVDAPLVVPGGRVVSLRFLRAKAERNTAPEKRRVSLRFRAVLDEDN